VPSNSRNAIKYKYNRLRVAGAYSFCKDVDGTILNVQDVDCLSFYS